jgi:hypothetical protein
MYYKPVTIVNENSRVISKLETSHIDYARVVIYDHNVFIVQATGLTLQYHNQLAFITTINQDHKGTGDKDWSSGDEETKFYKFDTLSSVWFLMTVVLRSLEPFSKSTLSALSLLMVSFSWLNRLISPLVSWRLVP